MRRFEQRLGVGGRFFTVAVVGDTCFIRHGELGELGHTQVEPCASEGAAAELAQQRARQQLQRGYVELRATTDDRRPFEPERKRALEQALARDPRNPEAWAVYADFIHGFMPELAQRIMVELARDASPPEHRRGLEQQLRQLDRRHRREWAGVELGRLIEKRGKTRPGLGLDWRYGFIMNARVLGRGLVPNKKRAKLDLMLGAVLASPAARFLSELKLTAGYCERTQVARALSLLQEHSEPRPALTRLELDSREVPMAVEHLLLLAPRLERLKLTGALEFHRLEHAHLVELKLRQREHEASHLPALAALRLPSLLSLELALPGVPPNEADGSSALDLIAELLRGAELPRLERFKVRMTGRGDPLAALFTKAPLPGGLRQLDLSSCHMSNEGAQRLLSERSRFARLERLDLRDNAIEREWVEALTRALPRAELDGQVPGATPIPYDDPDDREHDDIWG